jgi:succinate-semialdehyde dehydrogenase/glutarate-semialdehyde dehydrogenase
MIESINPATGEVIAQFTPLDKAGIDQALSAAATAQRHWAATSVSDRSALLTVLGEKLRQNLPALAGLITAEMGKPLAEARAEIEKCAMCCDYYAGKADEFLAAIPTPSNATDSYVVLDPLGLVLAIMPWNYPFWQLVRFAAPALAAGNGVVLKHAANVQQCAVAFAELALEAGARAGLVTNLCITAEQVACVLADDRIAAVTLTGSTEVGAIIAGQAGRLLKKQVLELGGSDPFIVLNDADVQAAAQTAVKARFQNTGQSCIASKRFILEEGIADAFVAEFTEGVAALKVGDPLDPATTVGPMARGNLRDNLERLIDLSVQAGAQIKLGGARIEGPGYYFSPTVLDHVTPEMAVFKEETFGPVAAVIRVADADAAIRLANATEFGLGAALWTRDLERAKRLVRQIEAGAVFVNGLVASDPRLPFGGIKRSGYGRELGLYGLREFTNVKTVWIGPGRVSIDMSEASMSTTSDAASSARLRGAIVRAAEQKSADRGNGNRTIPMVARANGSTSMINGITIIAPRSAIQEHYHNCEESILILEGRAIAVIDGKEHHLQAPDVSWVAAGVPHYFQNGSDSEPLKIFWTYASVDANRTNVATGETRQISAEHVK